MTALMAFNPATGELVAIDAKSSLGYLLLQAQRLEASKIDCYFQLGIIEPEEIDEDLSADGV